MVGDELVEGESSWACFDDVTWRKYTHYSGMNAPRFRHLTRRVLGDSFNWDYSRDRAKVPEQVIYRAAVDTRLRKKDDGIKRLVVAIAGSGWGKTSFKKGAEGSGLRVVDIDDLVLDDKKAQEMRLLAARGIILWKEVSDYTHAGVIEKIVSIQPDVVLNHTGILGALSPLAEHFAVEEWAITPPLLSSVVRRVRT